MSIKQSFSNAITSLFLLCQVSNILAQAPAMEWQKTIGGSNPDGLKWLQQTSDGGYILAGSSNSNISGEKTENSLGFDYWILKLDDTGAIQWQNTIGGSGNDEARSILQTDDGGYMVGGVSNSGISGDKTENSKGSIDYWVLKLSPQGDVEWQKTIGGSAADNLYAIRQTSDGGYILGGYSSSNISGDKTENCLGGTDFWVVKINATGNIEWQKTLGGSSFDQLRSLEQTSDGGYILGGGTYSDNFVGYGIYNHGQGDYHVIKLNQTGIIEWQKLFGGSDEEIIHAIQQTSDGGYILGGYSSSNSSGNKTENSRGQADYWIVKLNSAGAIQWQKTLGGAYWDEALSLFQTGDGGYIVGGISNSNMSGEKMENSRGSYDNWILKLSSEGMLEWQKVIGGSNSDVLLVIKQTNDGGCIFGGMSNSNISGEKTEDCRGGDDMWVVKLFPEIVGTTDVSNDATIYASPNPFSDVLRLNYPENMFFSCHIQVFDVTGRIVAEKMMPTGIQWLDIPSVGWSDGLYAVRILLMEKQTVQVLWVQKGAR